MKKGLSLIEALSALLIFSILLIVMLGFIRTGNNIFLKGFNNFLIKNEYEQFYGMLLKDIKNLKKIMKITNYELIFLTKDDHTVSYKILKSNNIIFKRSDNEIIFKHLVLSNMYFTAYNKEEKRSSRENEIILIKVHMSYLDNNNIRNNTFELFEI